MGHSFEEIVSRMDRLQMWKRVADCNWAVRPRGSVFPYFCTVFVGERLPVRARLLMLEGWQTFHDYVNSRFDRNYGFCYSPIELPHYELILLADEKPRLYRHDVGFRPVEVAPDRRQFVEKILWEAFGFMLRFETDRNLPNRYFNEQAIFSRVETADGVWKDEPLPILPPRPHVENVNLPPDLVKKVVDLPLVSTVIIDLDFRMLPNVMTREARPKCVYALVVVDAAGKKLVEQRVTVNPEAGLRGLWESLPIFVMDAFVAMGHVPGELRLCSGRVFRLLRPMCEHLPIKLTMKDALPALDAVCQDM